MTSDVVISGTLLWVLGGIGAILMGAISFLYRQASEQMKGRCERAERQVDTLLPAVTQLTGAIERLGDKM